MAHSQLPRRIQELALDDLVQENPSLAKRLILLGR